MRCRTTSQKSQRVKGKNREAITYAYRLVHQQPILAVWGCGGSNHGARDGIWPACIMTWPGTLLPMRYKYAACLVDALLCKLYMC
eukprot:2722777-Pleurochrysis_carterae.AAC.3